MGGLPESQHDVITCNRLTPRMKRIVIPCCFFTFCTEGVTPADTNELPYAAMFLCVGVAPQSKSSPRRVEHAEAAQAAA